MKKLLLIIVIISLAFIAIKAYASGTPYVAIIDTERCFDCGACYEAQTIWVVDDSENGYPYWTQGEGAFAGLLYYNDPPGDHRDVIELELIPVCPAGVFTINWNN